MADAGSWTIAGTYLEACNCEAICPCRRVGGRAGGRSTYGVCTGALSWVITSGHAGDVRLDGLGVVIACWYDDDEPGSPWTFRLYVDARGDDDQRRALVEILTGARGGTVVKHFPWAWKDSRFLGWQAAELAIDHTPGRGWFRAAGSVEVRVRAPVADQEPVACVIPGYAQPGTEYVADLLRVTDEPFDVDLTGRCAYESTFRYTSEED
jgi:hypothetical protein